jgi:hypothetical protein
MERDQLQHEVAMLRETVRHSAVQSADAARASRASLPSDTAAHDPPTNSMAAHFHAHTARIQELQGSIEVRRPSRSQHLPPSLRRTCLMRAPHARVRSGALAAHAALTPTHMCAARPERCCCHLQELEQERDSLAGGCGRADHTHRRKGAHVRGRSLLYPPHALRHHPSALALAHRPCRMLVVECAGCLHYLVTHTHCTVPACKAPAAHRASKRF